MYNPYVQQSKPSKEDVVLEYAPMVKHIANRLSARLPAGIQRDDLIQAGMIGLLEAAEKFDASQGNLFKTYAEHRVKGAMLDDLRSKDWIPRSVRDNSAKLERAFSALRGNNIDHPNDKQLSEALEIAPKELPEFLNKARPIPLLSLEGLASHGTGEEEEMNPLDSLSDPDAIGADEGLLGMEMSELLQEAIEKLPEKEKLVLALYYNEELNLKEIGAVLDLTESRVSQLRTKAIGMLRSLLKESMED
ncbi:MAG: FliA/WhiG family RNA polymerase sigma factor [bacterium]|nr:FliA/WhiG family RNA polymerase sigma factor [bacterium]